MEFPLIRFNVLSRYGEDNFSTVAEMILTLSVQQNLLHASIILHNIKKVDVTSRLKLVGHFFNLSIMIFLL